MSGGWVRESGGRLPTHVYPLNDLREHETNGAPCWCEPEIEDSADNETIVIHNSADGREALGDRAAQAVVVERLILAVMIP